MIQQILIGIALLIGVANCFANPFAGLITLMGVNMVQPGELYPLYNALHVERLVALLALAMLFVKGYRFLFPPVTQWVLYFYGACLASIPLAFWISNAFGSATDFGKIIVIHLLSVSLVTSRRRLRAMLLMFSVLVGYLAVTSLIMYFQGAFDFTMHVDRIVGLTNASNNPDTLGLTIATAMPLMFLFTYKSSSNRIRILIWILLGLVLWTLLLTGSRGSLLTLALITALAILISRRRLLLFPAVVVLSLAIWSVLPAQYTARYSLITSSALKTDESYQNRLLSWEGGWHMFLHNPLTGIGIGDYTFANGSKYWPAPRKIWLNAHSLYFQILGELGLIGVVTFGGFLVVMVRTNNRLRTSLHVIAARAAAGYPGAEPVPDWLRLLPTTCNLCLVGLLYCGYAYHDAYRSTWYFLAAITGAMDLMLRRELATSAAGPEKNPHETAEAVLVGGAIDWSALPRAEGDVA